MTATSSALDPNVAGIRSVVARHPVAAMEVRTLGGESGGKDSEGEERGGVLHGFPGKKGPRPGSLSLPRADCPRIPLALSRRAGAR